MTTPACSSYAGYRFPAQIISHAVWLYFRFPLSLRMVDEWPAARGIIVSHETVRQWVLKFGQGFANHILRRLPAAGDKWHRDEVVLTIAGVKHWLWRAVDQNGMVLDILVQSRRDTQSARRLLCKLMKRFKSAGQAQRFLSAHDSINTLLLLRRHQVPANQYRATRTQAFQVWAEVTGFTAPS